MTAGNNEVLEQSEKLAGALLKVKDGMSDTDFLLLLIDLNQKIEEVTRVDYGSICSPSACSCRR